MTGLGDVENLYVPVFHKVGSEGDGEVWALSIVC